MYQSTRNPKITASAKEAVLKGLALDGGLFVDPELGRCKIDIEAHLDSTYKELALSVFKILLPDYTKEELQSCIDGAYTGNFDGDDVAPLKKVGNVHVLELFKGPTCAFKDVALTILPYFMSIALSERNERALILTATSGDTGKAAMSGFMDVPNTGICVYYPDGGVSQIQYMQMCTQKGKNVRVHAVKGNFDDAQRGVKEIFTNDEIAQYAAKKGVKLSSANSINIGRLVPQVVYYFWAYIKLVNSGDVKLGDPVTFSVPTGNFGDVLAGYYAKILGLPVKKFIVASNENDVLNDFFKNGIYDANRPFNKTISPSMDILVSSNLERLLYYMSGNDAEMTSTWMQSLKDNGKYFVGNEMRDRLQAEFLSGVTDDAQTLTTIKKCYEETGYVLDTHTAVSYRIASEYADENDEPVVTLSTASPYKFPQAVIEGICGDEIDEWDALSKLKETNAELCPASLANIQNEEILHKSVIEKQKMIDTVKSAIDQLF